MHVAFLEFDSDMRGTAGPPNNWSRSQLTVVASVSSSQIVTSRSVMTLRRNSFCGQSAPACQMTIDGMKVTYDLAKICRAWLFST